MWVRVPLAGQSTIFMITIKELQGLSDEEWLIKFKDKWTISSVLLEFGLSPHYNKARREVRKVATRLGIERSNHYRHRYDKLMLQEAVAKALCWSDVMKHLGMQPEGGNQRTMKALVKEYQLNTDHFDIATSRARNKTRHTLESVMVVNSPLHRSSVRRFVMRNQLVEYVCAGCNNNGTWLDSILNLQLDHIDGDPTNNQLCNLRFLCPNCHSQTDTFGSKNR